MISSKICQLDIRELTKEQFSQFKRIRTKSSYLFGENSLCVRNHNKYIEKQLTAQYKLISSRPTTYPIYYMMSNRKTKIYMFPLIGEAMTGISLKRMGQNQISRWVNKCGGMELALQALMKFLLRITQEWNIRDIIPDCIRVQNCCLYYCYDSWIMDVRELVRQHPDQIENYYLSEQDLNEIRQCESVYSNKRYSTIFSILLYILSVGTFQLKLRNYQFGNYTIKWENLRQRLKYFQFNHNFYGLGSYIANCLEDQSLITSQLCSIPSNKKSKKNNIQKERKQNERSIIMNKTQDDVSESQKDVNNQSYVRNSISILGDVSNCQSLRKVRMMRKSIKGEKVISQTKKLNIKKKLIENQPQVAMKLIKYLQLDQYAPTNVYQKQLILMMEKIFIKINWERKIYPNGSVYLGEIVNEQRNGEGLYLFQSDDIFYGKWKNNNMDGEGIYLFKSGETYVGQLQDGAKHGHGTYYYLDGRIYEGSWYQNNKKGLGTLLFPNQVAFMAFFGNNEEGLFINKLTGEKWNGLLESYIWIDNTMKNKKVQSSCQKQKLNTNSQYSHKYLIKQESISEGQSFDQFGIYKKDKQTYEGDFKDNKFNGFGTIDVDQGFSISGIWKNGLLYQYENIQ